MANSVNGWPLVPAGSPQIVALPGVPVRTTVLGGSVATLLGYVAAQFHSRVEPITNTSSHRPGATIGNTSLFSNHASATAIDLNGDKHLQFKKGTFTAAQVTQIRQILAATRVIDWGGDWSAASVDEMHFEIRPKTTAQQVDAAALALTGTAPPTPQRRRLKDQPLIYRAGGVFASAPHGVYSHNAGWVILSSAEEKNNLRNAGVPEVWVEPLILTEVMKDSRRR